MATFDFDSNKNNHLFKTVVLFNDVESFEVCAILCTDENIDSQKNSWIYNSGGDRTCMCTKVDDQVCATDVSRLANQNEWLFIEQIKVKVMTHCTGIR